MNKNKGNFWKGFLPTAVVWLPMAYYALCPAEKASGATPTENSSSIEQVQDSIPQRQTTPTQLKEIPARIEPEISRKERLEEKVSTSVSVPNQNRIVVISPYDKITLENSKKYGVDFYLLLGQQMQESRFNPRAKNKLGARGLAQFMPDTAEELGYSPDEMFIPEKAIEAQTKYMKDIYNKPLIKDAPEQERIKLTIASYNAGYGNIQTALRIIKNANQGETNYTVKRKGKIIRTVNISEFRGLNQDWQGVSKVLPAVTGTRAPETIDYVEKVTGYAKEFRRKAG